MRFLGYSIGAWVLASAAFGAMMVLPRRAVERIVRFFREAAAGTDDLYPDEELHKLEREALDSTVRWAYSRGYLDALEGKMLTREATALIVQDFRLEWGEDRRETVG